MVIVRRRRGRLFCDLLILAGSTVVEMKESSFPQF